MSIGASGEAAGAQARGTGCRETGRSEDAKRSWVNTRTAQPESTSRCAANRRAHLGIVTSAEKRCPPAAPAPSSRSMRIAVISDTHDRFPPTLPSARGADEIWHLGDVCRRRRGGVRAARRAAARGDGNCDAHPWPLTLDSRARRCAFLSVHIPPRAASRGAHFILHVDTHVPRDETNRSARLRCSTRGCITRPNRVRRPVSPGDRGARKAPRGNSCPPSGLPCGEPQALAQW